MRAPNTAGNPRWFNIYRTVTQTHAHAINQTASYKRYGVLGHLLFMAVYYHWPGSPAVEAMENRYGCFRTDHGTSVPYLHTKSGRGKGTGGKRENIEPQHMKRIRTVWDMTVCHVLPQ